MDFDNEKAEAAENRDAAEPSEEQAPAEEPVELQNEEVNEAPVKESPAEETPACEETTQETVGEEKPSGEELLAAGDVPEEEIKSAEEALHPTKKTVSRLKVAVALLAAAALLLTAVSMALIVFSLGLVKRLDARDAAEKNNPKTTTYVPVVTPVSDAVASNAAIINVASTCSPSVVTVRTEIKTSTTTGTGSGSGVVYSEDGYIITNNHVIEDAVSASVVFADGSTYSATVIGTDPDNDLALLRINATGLSPVTFADGDKIMVGELAVAIGNPLGTLANTVTDGIVSSLARKITVDGYEYNVMQISCAINQGNSGGGVFNANGELIGIVNAKPNRSDADGIGFAIPVNTVKESIAKIAESDKTSLKKSIGITNCYEVNESNYGDYNKNYFSTYEQANDGEPLYGLYILGDGYVDYVDSKNVLASGDVLVSIDGKDVKTVDDVTAILESKKEGEKVTLKVFRLITSGLKSTTYTLEEKEITVRVVMMYR